MTSSKLPLTCNQGLGCWAMHRTPFWKTIHHKLLIKRYLIKILYSQHIDLLLKSLQLEIKYHFTFIYNLIQRTNLFGVASKLPAKVGKNCHLRRCVAVFVHITIPFSSTFIRNKQNYTKLPHKMWNTNIIPCKFPDRPYKLNSTSMCKEVLACIFQ